VATQQQHSGNTAATAMTATTTQVNLLKGRSQCYAQAFLFNIILRHTVSIPQSPTPSLKQLPPFDYRPDIWPAAPITINQPLPIHSLLCPDTFPIPALEHLVTALRSVRRTKYGPHRRQNAKSQFAHFGAPRNSIQNISPLVRPKVRAAVPMCSQSNC
jgi:hypothetical protein